MEITPPAPLRSAPFWVRLMIVIVALAVAYIGLTTIHSAAGDQSPHSHGEVWEVDVHSSVEESTQIASAASNGANGTSGFLAQCERCALGTVTGADGAALTLLLFAAVFVLTRNGDFLTRLIDGWRSLSVAAAPLHGRITPGPLVMGISRT